MSRDRSIEERLRSLRREAPPAGLRARVLDLAKAVERPRVTLTDRLWHSRPLRFAWAAALAILILLDPDVGRRTPARGGGGAMRETGGGVLTRLSGDLDRPGGHLGGLPSRHDKRFDINDARREELARVARDLEM